MPDHDPVDDNGVLPFEPYELPGQTPLDEPAREHLSLATQLFRFIVVGVACAVIDYGVTASLQYGLDWPELAAKSVGFICGTTAAYLINRRWTFRAEPNTRRLIAVWVLYLATYGVQVGIYVGLLDWWSEEPKWHSLAAFVIAQGTATVLNFIVQRVVIFKIV